MLTKTDIPELNLEPPTEEPGRRSSSAKQKFAVFKRLMEVCSTSEDGYATYKEGHNDATVAAECGVVESTVQHYRAENFGFIRKKVEVDPATDAETRMAALEARLTRIEKELGINA